MSELTPAENVCIRCRQYTEATYLDYCLCGPCLSIMQRQWEPEHQRWRELLNRAGPGQHRQIRVQHRSECLHCHRLIGEGEAAMWVPDYGCLHVTPDECDRGQLATMAFLTMEKTSRLPRHPSEYAKRFVR